MFVALQRRGGYRSGPVDQLAPRAVARIVRAAAEGAGLASSELNEFSSHSLRRGLITTALDAGAAIDDVMRHAQHGTIQSTLRYREVGDAVGQQPRVAIGPPRGQIDRWALDRDQSAAIDCRDDDSSPKS